MAKNSVMFVRPKNWSYEEYAKMINTMCEHLGIPSDMTDEELREKYRIFIAKMKKEKRAQNSAKPTTSKRAPRKGKQ